MNKYSSRSHTIFQLFVEMVVQGRHHKVKINLCDLAGNEKFRNIENFSKQRFAEMKSINQSLTTLGKVTKILSQPSASKRGVHVPYRESKLTRVLQDSLGGSSRTFLLATLSPLPKYIEETFNTLKFAQRTSRVQVSVKDEFEEVKKGAKVMDHLKNEIKYLKSMLKLKRSGNGISSYIFRIKQLESENCKLKKYKFSMSDYKKLINENKKIKSELDTLKDMKQSTSNQLDESINFGDSLNQNQDSPIQKIDIDHDLTIEMIRGPPKPIDQSTKTFVNQKDSFLDGVASKKNSVENSIFEENKSMTNQQRMKNKYGQKHHYKSGIDIKKGRHKKNLSIDEQWLNLNSQSDSKYNTKYSSKYSKFSILQKSPIKKPKHPTAYSSKQPNNRNGSHSVIRKKSNLRSNSSLNYLGTLRENHLPQERNYGVRNPVRKQPKNSSFNSRYPDSLQNSNSSQMYRMKHSKRSSNSGLGNYNPPTTSIKSKINVSPNIA